jgi:hypothetical protein
LRIGFINMKIHAERYVGSVLPMGSFQHPSGWATQVGQQGGKPAVAVYRDGALKRVRYLTGEREAVSAKVADTLPSTLKWQGTRSNFRILGQVRNNVFESLIIAMHDDDVAIANLTDSVITTAMHNGLSTPSLNKAKGKPLSERTVLTSIYKDVVRVAWFNRKTGKVIKRVKLERL